MSDLIQRLRSAYTENPASALKLIPEVLQAADDGWIVELPCKPNNAYWHRNYDTGGLELNFEMHDLERHDDTYREIDCCAYWE